MTTAGEPLTRRPPPARVGGRQAQTRHGGSVHDDRGEAMTTPPNYHPADPESVFTYGAPQLKFGHGAADEIGYDLSLTGARRVLVVTDPGVAATGNPQRVADQMGQFGIDAHVYEGSRVEPTDESLQRAIDHARDSGPWDAYVAVGGG